MSDDAKNPQELSDVVKTLARDAGFAAVGVTRAELLMGIDKFRQAYLNNHYNADMEFLADNMDKRFDPRKLLPGTRSVICLAMSYAPKDMDTDPQPISYYARGRDYHKVLKKRAIKITKQLAEIVGPFDSRVFVDTAPVEERQLAVMAGIGWQGKNGMLIVPGVGSMVVLAEIFCSLDIAPDLPNIKNCGLCKKCIEACPTGALLGDGLLDARKCISYHTIENRGDEIPANVACKMSPRIFGCDSCAVACPYNQEIPVGDAELVNDDFESPSPADVINWTFDNWDDFTRGSARRRATLEMYKRNAKIAMKK